MLEKFDEKNKMAVDAYTVAEAYGTITGPSVNFINNVSLTLVCVFGSLLFLQGKVQLGDLSSFVQYSRKLSLIHISVDLDVSRPQMHLVSAYDNGDELLKKTDVMALYDYRRSVGIGDSFTDRNMSQAVDTIFARDILAQYLQKCGLPYLPYEDFYDVIRQFPV